MEKQQQTLNSLINQVKEQIYNKGLEVEQAILEANNYPGTFKGNTVLDYSAWAAGRKAVIAALEDRQRELRHLKTELRSLLDQQQINMFDSS